MVISGGIIRRKVFLRAWIMLCMLLNAVTPQNVDEKGLSACELETLVKQILNPNPEYQMHANSLRNQLGNMLQSKYSEGFQSLDDSNDYLDEDKRSVSSLARSGIIPTYGKRYLGSLARTGMMLRSSNYDDMKRSVANLAKNGQLPTQEPEVTNNYDDYQWEEKRNLGSLAKSGGVTGGKRNIGTLARDYQLPNNGKRNLAALARIGLVPKRNIAALARQNSYYQAEKKNIGALKNSPIHGSFRQKRDTYDFGDYEVPDEVIQNYSMDYEDLKNTMNRLYGGPYEEKRFLGSVAKGGWYRSMDKRNVGSLARLGLLRSEYTGFGSRRARDQYRQQEQKRHIGALARSDITPNKSDFYNPPRPFVDDVTPIKNIQTQLAGGLQDYLAGVHHPDSQLYIGGVYDPQVITAHEPNNNNKPKDSENDEFLDYLVLSQKQPLGTLVSSAKDKISQTEENQCDQRLRLMLDSLSKQ